MTRRSLGGKADRTGVDRTGGALAWEHELERWMAPFIEGLGHKGRRRWAARGNTRGKWGRRRTVSVSCRSRKARSPWPNWTVCAPVLYHHRP